MTVFGHADGGQTAVLQLLIDAGVDVSTSHAYRNI